MATIDQLPLLPGPLLPSDVTLVRRNGRTYRAPVPLPGEASIGGIPGLQDALDSKASAGHGHSAATASAAGFMGAADKAKLDGVAAGATANASDAQLRSRSTHTGEQAIGTITGLQQALESKAAAAHGHGVATASAAGFMSSADKAKLDGLQIGVGGAPTLAFARDLARATWKWCDPGAVLQIGATYSVYAGGGAITAYLPKRADVVVGDRIEFLNLHMTWPSAGAFTVARQETGTWFCGPRGMFDSDLVLDRPIAGFALQVVWKDGPNIWWNVVF